MYMDVWILNAANFNSCANIPDSSCLLGCTDPVATNYDATATNDDGSCVYPCSYYGYDDDLTVTLTPDWFSSEISWYLLDQNLDTVLSSPMLMLTEELLMYKLFV